ncbi:MAG: PP2C family protein-serine/threonine phosphatase [Ignavibacteriales bacterium]|nr:PP2C family protein-serine/threonine phosphatase [Ignavibacteriales bacterium]
MRKTKVRILKPAQLKKSRPGTNTYIRRLEYLIEASKQLNTTFDLEKLLGIILNLALRNLDAERGTIYLIDEERRELWSKVLKGARLVEIRLPIGTGISGYVAKTGKTVLISDASKDKRFYSGIDKKSGFQTKTMLCMPMRNRSKKIIGVFQIINKKQGQFSEEDKLFLAAFSDHAALAIENARLHLASLEKERVERELSIAAEIQQRLLPEQLPAIKQYDVAAAAFPCRTIGGDFYDVVELDDHRFAIVMADVSGKGIPASLLVSTLHASFRAYIQAQTDLAALVTRLNKVVYDNTTPDKFITFFIMILDVHSHTVNYVNAGHNSPFLFRGNNGKIEELAASGLPLGMIGDSEYTASTLQLEAHDVVVLYTDGVTEAMDKSQNQYGEDRFRHCISSSLESAAVALKDKILVDVREFVGLEPASDDLTLLVAKRMN